MARHSYYKLAQIYYLLLNNHLGEIVNPSIEGEGLVPGLEISARLYTYLHTPPRGGKTCRVILFTQPPASQLFFRAGICNKRLAQLCRVDGKFAPPAWLVLGSRGASALEVGGTAALASKKDGFKDAVTS